VTPVTPQGVVPQELSVEGDCRLSHLGRTRATTTQFVTPTGQFGPTVTLLITNRTVYTSANGDRLNMSFIGTGLLNLVSGEVTFIGVETFEGGTGRFARATGSAEVQGSASILTNLGSFETEGRLAY
jgi:hypothetical protein